MANDTEVVYRHPKNLVNFDKLYDFDTSKHYDHFDELNDLEKMLYNSTKHQIESLNKMLQHCEIINEKLVNLSKLIN